MLKDIFATLKTHDLGMIYLHQYIDRVINQGFFLFTKLHIHEFRKNKTLTKISEFKVMVQVLIAYVLVHAHLSSGPTGLIFVLCFHILLHFVYASSESSC